MNAWRMDGAAIALALGAAALGCGSATVPPDASGGDAASVDVGADTAAPSDSGVSFTAMTLVSSLSENCMPAVPPDPLPITGTVQITNTGSTSLGPIHVESGLVVQLLGGDTLATFDVEPIDLPAIAPGASASMVFTKTDGSLAGGAGLSGCDIVACGSAVRIALILTGPGVPEGARASSEPLTVGCAF
ncbi:MAG: hypothetical protein U0234_11770 [Sandaracinus sp.]